MNIDGHAIRRLRDFLLNDIEIAAPDGSGAATAAPPVLRRLEPFAETMYVVMMADQDSASAERQALNAAMRVLADGALAQVQIEALLDDFDQRLRSQGSEARLAHIGALLGRDREDRETAFALGAVAALADRRFDARENQALKWAQASLGLSDVQVTRILDAME